jgi:ubiquinone biosynthesis protein COQ4
MTSTQTHAPIGDLAKLSTVERWRRGLRALATVVADPEQTDQVLVFANYVNAGTSPSRLQYFFDDPSGQRLFAEHRTIDSHTVDLDQLAALPAGTLGHAYAEFLQSRGFTPDVFEGSPEGVSDPRASYLIQRLRQTHDLWHVVTGTPTDPGSEVALQAFTYAQVGAPSALILSIVGTLRGLRQKPGMVRDVVAAYRTGIHAEKLAAFPWEDHWATPLAEVRAMLHLPLVPRTAIAAAA